MAFRTGDEGVGPAVSRLFRRLKEDMDSREGSLTAYVDSLAKPEAWISMNLTGSGWSNYGFGWAPAAYRKVGDMVHIRGLIAGQVSGSVITIMPAGYRPLGGQIYSTMCDVGGGNILARLDIASSGALTPYFAAGTAAYLSINISYSTV